MIHDVKFLGLSHSPSDYDAQDGELGTCLNLICEDGALKPVPQPVVTDGNIVVPDGASILMVHKVTHASAYRSHYIIRLADGSVSWTERGGDATLCPFALGSFAVNAVSAVGNILCFVGDRKTLYAYWQDDGYTVLDFSSLSYSANIAVSKTEQKYGTVEPNDSFTASVSTADYTVGSGVPNFERFTTDIPQSACLALFASKDAYTNKYMGEYSFKYVQFGVLAVRLYDGTRILVGNPFLLDAASEIDHTVYLLKALSTLKYKEDGAKEYTFGKGKTYAMYAGQTLSEFDMSVAFADIARYEDIIDGIDVFVSNSIYPYKTTEMAYDASVSLVEYSTSYVVNTEEYGNWSMQTFQRKLAEQSLAGLAFLEAFARFDFKPLTIDELYRQIDSLSFYKSTSFSFDEVKKGVTKKLNRIYCTEETLPLADFRRAAVGAKVAMTYNNRLHLADVSSSLPMPFNGMVSASGSAECEVVAHTKFKTDGTLCESWTVASVAFPLSSILSFPSPDVSSFEIFFHVGSLYRHFVVDLHKSDSFGLSYYVNYSDGKFYSFPTRTDGQITADEYEVVRQQALAFSASGTHSPSVIKVSEAENPLVFPAKDSVQVGSSTINALAANTRPVSEGQFGDAPLYAFTDEGVWVLMLAADGSYMARQPVSRDICSNPAAILQIDNAVLFPTERGIMMQQGNESVCITDALYCRTAPFDFTQLYSADFARKVLAFNGTPEDEVKYVPFSDFLSKADMIYDYYGNRILLFNPDCHYAYVYSLRSRMWGTVSCNIRQRVNAYPDALAIDGNSHIVNVHVPHPDGNVPFVICSRPLSLNAKDVHKTMFTCLLRGYLGGEDVGMALYGSNVLLRWVPVKTAFGRALRGMAGSPYKFFRVAVVGSLAADESITGVSTEFIERWQNKLR